MHAPKRRKVTVTSFGTVGTVGLFTFVTLNDVINVL
jgi:hypothetical protein